MRLRKQGPRRRPRRRRGIVQIRIERRATDEDDEAPLFGGQAEEGVALANRGLALRGLSRCEEAITAMEQAARILESVENPMSKAIRQKQAEWIAERDAADRDREG